MPDKLSFSKTFQAIENTLNIIQKRHGLIVSNISNAETPDYKAKDMDFKAALSQALEPDGETNLVRTHPAHIAREMRSAEGFEIIDKKGEWNGINRVNIDKEMMRLMENNLMYRATIETLLKKIAIVKEVIRGGGQ